MLEQMYKELGISKPVLDFGKKCEDELKERFLKIDENAELNQLKVINAMQKNKVSAECFNMSSGYGYNDLGRDTLEKVYADCFKGEDALVRPQITCGTHALALALMSNLRPGDELLSPVGKPYDTLEEVIGIRPSKGSLSEYGVTYSQVDLLPDGEFDFEGIRKAVNEKTKLVTIQRSKGYATRPTLSVERIGELIKFIKEIKPDVICMVDNCYGEFVEDREPLEVGADMIVGSLIKNPGGGLAPIGGYIVGKKECVENAAYRLTSPGLGKEVGASLGVIQSFYQGLFLSPTVVSGALKGAIFAAKIYEKLGFKVVPDGTESRHDIIQAIEFHNRDAMIAFCEGIQAAAPVDSYVTPEPWAMPGIDGREALQKIRRQENGLCKESAVLLMTAEGDSSIINKIMEEGFDGYIEKPVQGNGLEASIMSFIPNELLEFKAKTENVVVKTLAGETIIKPNVLKKKLIITTDCVCDISTGEAKQLGIMQVYLYVNTPSGRFKDTIEIGIDNVSSMLEKDRRNIHASAVSVEDYENFFASRLTEAEEVLHLSFGKNMGKSYWNAISAAKCFGSVHVLDSGLLSCGLSIVIKYASEALKNGASLEEITKLVQDMKGRVNTRFLLDSIDPFYENGYIGKKMRNIFNLFHLHPILAAKKSGLHIDGFMLGDIDSARIRFIKKTVKKIKNKTVNDIYVSHTGISVKQQEMAASVIEKAGICDNVVIHKSSVTNACFSGPGTIGIAYYKK